MTIALAKGKICTEGLKFLQDLDIYPTVCLDDSRKLLIESNREDIQFIIVRSTDVPAYVRYGIADFGIVGKDVILEQTQSGYYEVVDLKFSACRLMLATLAHSTDWKKQPYLRVATKFNLSTQRWFAKQRQQVEIIHLNGAIELAATSGLSHAIVDLVSTGATLKANGLVALETIAEISSRLIINEQAYKYRDDKIIDFINACTKKASEQ